MFPVVGIAFERGDREDPNAVGLGDIKQRVGEARHEMTPDRRVDLTEAEWMRADLGDHSLDLIIETAAQGGSEASVLGRRVGKFRIGLAMRTNRASPADEFTRPRHHFLTADTGLATTAEVLDTAADGLAPSRTQRRVVGSVLGEHDPVYQLGDGVSGQLPRLLHDLIECEGRGKGR